MGCASRVRRHRHRQKRPLYNGRSGGIIGKKNKSDRTEAAAMKTIISASRRTDIPAFYIDWFIERLYYGHLYVKNPYSSKIQRVSLASSDVHSIVFWSKNFTPLLKKLERIERVTKNLFFHYTITGAPKELEPHTPEREEAVKDLIFLSKRFSPEHVVWRFDPIVVTDRCPLEGYKDIFIDCAARLKGSVRACYISFVHPYKKVIDNFRRYSNHRIIEVPEEKKRAFTRELASVAGRFGIEISACCNDMLLSQKVLKGSCIDGPKLSKLFCNTSVDTAPRPTRKGCGCTVSTDIGSYDTCPHGCLYCYANSDVKRALRFYRMHNPSWNGLGFNVEDTSRPSLERTDLGL